MLIGPCNADGMPDDTSLIHGVLRYGLVFEGAKSAHEASLHGPGLIVSGLRYGNLVIPGVSGPQGASSLHCYLERSF